MEGGGPLTCGAGAHGAGAYGAGAGAYNNR